MLTLKKIEYIDYRDKMKLSLKLFGIFNIIFILNNIFNNNTYKSNFTKSTSFSKVLLNFDEEKSAYYLSVSILKFLKINDYISLENIIKNREITAEVINTETISNDNNDNNIDYRLELNKILELNCIENNINSFYNLELKYPIDIIIPVYNGFKYLKDLFNSIFNNTNINYRLIIINDCSTDENVYNYLKSLSNEGYQYCKEIILLNNKENLGFIKSVNKGCNYVKNHFVLLNTDVIVPKDWLNRIIYPIINNNSIASVTPFTNSGTICSFPIFCQDNELFLNLDVEKLDNVVKTIPYFASYREIPTAVGFCMAINKNVFDDVGYLDTIFGKGYGEENDWCMRASEKGYKHLIAGNLFVFHNHGGSFIPEEKQALLEKNLNTLTTRYPYYNKLIQEYIKKDDLKLIRDTFIIKVLSTQKDLKTNVVLTHNIGGGTEVYLKNYMKNKTNDELYLTIKEYNLYDKSQYKYLLSLQYKNIDIELIFYDLYEIITLLNNLNIKNINNIIINHLIGFKLNEIIFFILNLKNKYKSRIIFKVHDYMLVCKKYNLLYRNEYFCNVPDVSLCNECINNFDIIEYRRIFEHLLENIDDIIVFSNSSKEIILKSYPKLEIDKIKVIPHKVDWIKRKAKVSNKKEVMNIGILGNIGFEKGSNILEEIIEKSKDNNFNYYLFGIIDHNIEKLNMLGPYTHDNIVDLVDQYDIDIFIIPSIWPETFCYTAEEIILMDKPIMVFNLGAPAERVSNYDKGYIVNKISADAMYKELVNFYNKL